MAVTYSMAQSALSGSGSGDFGDLATLESFGEIWGGGKRGLVHGMLVMQAIRNSNASQACQACFRHVFASEILMVETHVIHARSIPPPQALAMPFPYYPCAMECSNMVLY